MSHELRTPINAMLGYTSLLREEIYGDLSEKQEDALGKIHSSAEHLLTLINDILDLSRIEAGRMPIQVEETDLHEVVEELSQTLEPMLLEKGLDFRMRLADGLPTMTTDRTKVKQILLNLLSNAVKFTSEGMVELRVGADEERATVVAEVEDTGIGIEPEALGTIFDDFRQVDESPTRRFGGTGLGLAITRRLVDLLGGSLGVESEPDEGSTFTVELPVVAEPAGQGGGASSPSSSPIQ
jgi:signal transduction histidine kinase